MQKKMFLNILFQNKIVWYLISNYFNLIILIICT